MAAIYAAAFDTKRPWSENEFSELIASDYSLLVTSSDVSFALGRVIADEAELITIATVPSQHRKGHARQCLKGFIDQCRLGEAQSVFLEVDELNSGAIALYASLGFEETGRREEYYPHIDGSRSAAVLMTLKT